MSELALTTPIGKVPGVGAARAAALEALGITNAGKLIAHLPHRHEAIEAEAPIAELVPGALVSARGEVTATRVVQKRPRPRFEAVLTDETGRLDLVWFNQLFLRQKIQPGVRLRVQGPAKRFGYGLQIANPTFAVLTGEEPLEVGRRLRPVYPASEAITSRQIEAIMGKVIEPLAAQIEDHLSEEFRRARELPVLGDAYRLMHAPAAEADVASARRRLAYDELLLLQLGVAIKRRQLRQTLRAPALRHTPEVDRHIRERFPFALTAAQDAVIAELARDLATETPTNRLIQGDVGSGKTVVALYAMLLAVASNQQAALMAPTEILAEQHHRSISKLLEGSRVRVELLTGSVTGEARQRIMDRVAAGEVDLLIGTHAILTESVRFSSLAVAIIDEQHRFGVHQRAALRSKATDPTMTPHVVVMTATPIPRTLAITLFGDLDISTITGLPPGRTAIATRLVGPELRGEVYRWVRSRLDAGDQAYIVAPAIDSATGDEGLPMEPAGDVQTPMVDVKSLVQRLSEGELKGKRVAELHSRVPRATREAIMERFRAGAIDAVVATTVIEVGVDVANATVMVIEQAERFGLAQLHQLRGRVGRGSKKSACVLISDLPTDQAAARLEVMTTTSDGFVLAERDLEIRGPGELFGTRQSGLSPLKVADLARDLDLLKLARKDAAEWIGRSPRLDRPEEATLRRRLLKAHGEWLSLGDVG